MVDKDYFGKKVPDRIREATAKSENFRVQQDAWIAREQNEIRRRQDEILKQEIARAKREVRNQSLRNLGASTGWKFWNRTPSQVDPNAPASDRYTPNFKRYGQNTAKVGKKVAVGTVALGAGLVAGTARRARNMYQNTAQNPTYQSDHISRQGGLVWFFLAVALFIIDYLTRFNGFNADIWVQTFNGTDPLWILRVLFSSGFFLFWIVYLFIKQPDLREAASFFMLTGLVWIVMVAWKGFSDVVALLHVLFAFFVLYQLIYPAMLDRRTANLLIAAMVFFDLFLFSLLGNLIPNAPFLNRFTLPIWVFLTLAYTRPSRLKGWITLLIVLLYVFNAFAEVQKYQGSATVSEYLSQQEINSVKGFFVGAGQGIKNLKDSLDIFAFIERQKRIIGGEYYYTGDIDQEAEQKLGVYFNNLQSTQTAAFMQGEPASVSAEVQAQTLKDPILARLSCGTEEAKGVMIPDTLEVSDYDQTLVDCHLPPDLTVGSHEVTLHADFNFETTAYIQSYFIDKKDVRPKEDKTQQLTRHGISDFNPVAVYTSGPINIGMFTGTVPIVIDRTSTTQVASVPLRFTFTNQWEGELKDVTKMIIQLPAEFELMQESDGRYCGGKEFQKVDCTAIDEAGCNDNLHTIYQLDEKQINYIKDIKQNEYETVTCRIVAKNPDDLFSDKSVYFSTKHFRVIVGYNYQLFGTTGVEIKEGESIPSLLPDCTRSCSDPDGCYCPDACSISKEVLVQQGKTCGSIGLTKDKVSVPAPECMTLSSCADQFTFSCPSKEYEVISIGQEGKLTATTGTSATVSYGDYEVEYAGLKSSYYGQVGNIFRQNDPVGLAQESVTVSITKEGNSISLTDLYDENQFEYTGSCVQPINDCGECASVACQCGTDCVQAGQQISRGENCGGKQNVS